MSKSIGYNLLLGSLWGIAAVLFWFNRKDLLVCIPCILGALIFYLRAVYLLIIRNPSGRTFLEKIKLCKKQ